MALASEQFLLGGSHPRKKATTGFAFTRLPNIEN